MRPGRPEVGFDRLARIANLYLRGATAGERSAAAAAFDRAAARTPYAGIGIERFARAIPRLRQGRGLDVLRRTAAIEAQWAAEWKQFVEIVQHAEKVGYLHPRTELEFLCRVGRSLRIGPLTPMDALRLASLWRSRGEREAAAKVAAAWMAAMNRPRRRR